MSPIQQMLLGAGAVATKTYVDDVFSTYVYEGDGNSSRNITNNIDLLTEGGLVWYKSRSAGKGHRLVDTERGVTKVIESNDSNAEAVEATGLKAFLTNGFTVGSDDTINESGGDQASWSFRKAPGFFDVVTWTGNGSSRTISHSLGSVPGMILVKNTSSTIDWTVWHRGATQANATNTLTLNSSGATATNNTYFDNGSTPPTSTNFTVHTSNRVNANGDNYVAYVFAGGESTAATARSVKFDTNDFLSFANTSDFVFGTGAYTVEFWIKPYNTPNGDIIFSGADTNGFVINMNSDRVNINKYSVGDIVSSTSAPPVDQWTHYAFVREGTGSDQTKIYVNGRLDKIGTDDNNWTVNANWGLGARNSDGNYGIESNLSNFRIVKGTAVYTSSFKPPTEPLTNITNTKLLCCNGSSTTSSTVTPGTITANGDPTASTDSPFDDPAGFVFGESGSESVIKCGSYVGNGSDSDPVGVYLGFEPQFLLIKRTDTTSNWQLIDSMRGFPVDGNNWSTLRANTSAAETDSYTTGAEPTATGFNLVHSWTDVNASGGSYIFTAIRRSDGYCGKPPELGTGVFAMDTGNSSSTVPCFDSGFPVDFLLQREFASQDSWITGSRHTGNTYMYTNASDAEAGGGGQGWDSNVGGGTSRGSSYQAWMWKRHAGFDVVTYTGNGVAGRQIPHSLNKSVEMIWLKSRSHTNPWMVYHKGLDGGTNPSHKYLQLNSTSAESDASVIWNDTAPTANHFTIGSHSYVNADAYTYLAMLFASVDGISKVGYYTGNASGNVALNCGFVPRFFMTKAIDANTGWLTVDSTRDVNMGKRLFFDSTAAETSYDAVFAGQDYIESNKTGLSVNGVNYIFYAHK